MKWYWMPMLLGVCLLAFADDLKIPITDKSEQGVPLQNVGSITMAENIQGGTSAFSYKGSLAVSNVSQKAVVAFVEELDVKLPNGHATREIKIHDMFFTDKLFNPGDTLDLSNEEANSQFAPAQYSSPQGPVAELRTTFVQFNDGTTFGDKETAARLFETRQTVWNAVAHLNEVYMASGESVFVEELQKPVESKTANAYLTKYRLAQKEKGTQATIAMIRTTLALAEQRQSQIAK